jgi:hypothetical protein
MGENIYIPGQNHDRNLADKSFKNVTNLKYFGTTGEIETEGMNKLE